MSKYKPQHRRLLFIDKKLREGHFPNCSSLAEEWEVSSKTFQRDLEYLRYELDAPIKYSAKKRGFYYTEENFNLPAIAVKESDLFAIYLAEELLEQYKGTPLFDRLSSIYKKIEDSLPSNNNIDAINENTKFTVFPAPSTTICPTVWETVFEALKASKTLKIHYKTPRKTSTIRNLDPYHAVRYDGDWYIFGKCHTRKEIRTFSLSRIETAVIVPHETFSVPKDFNFHQITFSKFGIHWGTHEQHVKLWFSKDVAHYVLERKWHPTQQIHHNEDGSLLLSLTVNHTLELKRWVLSWGKNAKVIDPTTLADEFKDEIKNLSAMYENS